MFLFASGGGSSETPSPAWRALLAELCSAPSLRATLLASLGQYHAVAQQLNGFDVSKVANDWLSQCPVPAVNGGTGIFGRDGKDTAERKHEPSHFLFETAIPEPVRSLVSSSGALPSRCTVSSSRLRLFSVRVCLWIPDYSHRTECLDVPVTSRRCQSFSSRPTAHR